MQSSQSSTSVAKLPAARVWLWLRRIIILVLLIVAVAQFARRLSPSRAKYFFDFSNVYSASRVWLAGGDPFDLRQVYAAWERSGHGRYLGATEADPGVLNDWVAVHPPPSLVMLAPLALMPAVPAHLAWLVLNLVLFTLFVIALWSMGGLREWETRLLLVACLLAAAPVQDGFESGQLGFIAGAVVVLAAWAYTRRRCTLAGVLLGLAMAVKTQVGAPFLLYYVLLRQWRVATLAAVVFGIVLFVGVLPLQRRNIPWMTEWRRNVAQTLEPGEGNDPRPGGRFRNDMINLQTLLYCATNSDGGVRIAVIVIVLPLAAAFLFALRNARFGGADLLALSVVACLSFLPVYRRLYDATLLAMLATWALANLRTSLRGAAIVTLALLAELFVPIDLVPFVLRRTHHFDAMIATSWWQGLVVPHHAWAILALAVWSTYLYWSLHQPAPTDQISNSKSQISNNSQ